MTGIEINIFSRDRGAGTMVARYGSVMKNAAIVILLLAASAAGQARVKSPGAAELAVFRPSNAVWYTQSADVAGGFTAVRWGLASDVLVPADYDGDGSIDSAVWRAETGMWYIQQSSDAKTIIIKWGGTTIHPTGGLPDVPVPADFDGDGKADIAIWRPDTGEWYVLRSSLAYDQSNADVFRWGKLGDVPVQEDYDGDGRVDFAVFRPSSNRWYILESSTQNWKIYTFGLAGIDMLAPADYTGDGKADIAVYRRGTWYVLNSATGETEPFRFGFDDAAAVPGDYDGDGKTDFAVFRKGTWYIYDSATPRLRTVSFGSPGDVPLNSLAAKTSIVAVP